MKAVAVGVRWFGVLILSGWMALPSCAETPAKDAPSKDTLVKDTLVENVAGEDDVDAQWIWSPAHAKNEVPVGDCYFRKSFKLGSPELGEVQITADNDFQLFVNGQPVGQGADWRQLEVYDISKQLQKGVNTIAVQVTNIDEGSAGLVARVLIKEAGGTFTSYSTNKTWKTSVRRYQNWTTPTFPESEWIAAASYGQLGAALPWGDEIVFAGEGARFQIPDEFTIERLMRDEEVGSLIAMTFDSRGNILASREGGPLLLLTDSDDNGTHDSVTVFCDKITNTQGILALGTRVFAVGDGPEGVALYRLRDADRDGLAEEITKLVPIRGSKGEHGAHAVRLGPDGLLYVILGNHTRVGVRPGPRSPYRNWYEGDLVQPRQEDPHGHAAGIPAPGGTIFRTDANGSFVELVAGGFRNPYDFAFSADGELFTYDADMEWDLGAPWYRPTRLNHVTAGAEFGWRSGWAKWPEHFLDSLPAMTDIGPGSPTGLEFYNHTVYPEQYRGALFGCDWATGRIHCVRLERSGATYRGKSEVFVAGRPLNATDISVGPDGAIYFCTGGRGTDGGVYRVRWTGESTSGELELEQGIDRALRQPQLDADWARARVAGVRVSLGANWEEELQAAARDTNRVGAERQRALDLMVYFGPRPSDELLLELSQDTAAEVRAKAVQLMFNCTTEACQHRLVALLEDDDPRVRRIACETLARSGMPTSVETHVRMLSDDDRFVALAARRSLEQLPTHLWDESVLNDPDISGFCQGAVSLLACRRDAETAEEVLTRCQSLLDSVDAHQENELVDLLRAVQLALIHGKLAAADVPGLDDKLLAKYPSGNHEADRELVRLLVYLQVNGAAQKFAYQLDSDLPNDEKLHLGAYAAHLQRGWDTKSKLALMKYYEAARALSDGYSVSAYVENFAREFFTKLSLKERRHILAAGERWPASALSVLAKLPVSPDSELLTELRELDQRVRPLCAADDRFRRLRVGILAVLGRSDEEQSLQYLREIYRDEPDWRDPVAMTLTQHPEGESWSYLVESLKVVRGSVAREVLAALVQVPQRPREPEPYRQVILLGLQLGDGANLALELLNHWSGQPAADESQDPAERLAQWQAWYAKNFPSAPPAELPVDSGRDKWSYEELLTYLESSAARNASAQRGEVAFTTAQCIKCHRCGSRGETLGPDLSTVAKRFQKKEILESVIYPSHVISDQYASRTVLSNGRTFTGLVTPRGSEGVTVLMNDGEQLELAHEEIEQILPSSVSSMPTGLLNSLTLEQVADLFAFLGKNHRPSVAEENRASQR